MSTSQAIVITRYPAQRGSAWLRDAFRMLAAARVQWLMLVVLYYLTLGVLDLIPVLGPLAVPVLKPVFAVGFLAAAWAQERGGVPELRQLFQGFRSNLWALLTLGVVLLVGITLSMLATALVDGGKLLEVLTGQVPFDEQALAGGEIQQAMLFGIACAVPLLLALWYAPALVVFHDCSAARALALSLRASIANWRPLAVYGVMVVFYGAVIPGLLAGVVAMLLPASAAPYIGVLVLMPYVLLFIATLHISDYVSYRDIFHANERADAARATPPGDASP